jgi:hypothetical protein
MEIRPAQTNRGHAQQHFSRRGNGYRLPFDPDIADPVDPSDAYDGLNGGHSGHLRRCP